MKILIIGILLSCLWSCEQPSGNIHTDNFKVLRDSSQYRGFLYVYQQDTFCTKKDSSVECFNCNLKLRGKIKDNFWKTWMVKEGADKVSMDFKHRLWLHYQSFFDSVWYQAYEDVSCLNTFFEKYEIRPGELTQRALIVLFRKSLILPSTFKGVDTAEWKGELKQYKNKLKELTLLLDTPQFEDHQYARIIETSILLKMADNDPSDNIYALRCSELYRFSFDESPQGFLQVRKELLNPSALASDNSLCVVR